MLTPVSFIHNPSALYVLIAGSRHYPERFAPIVDHIAEFYADYFPPGRVHLILGDRKTDRRAYPGTYAVDALALAVANRLRLPYTLHRAPTVEERNHAMVAQLANEARSRQAAVISELFPVQNSTGTFDVRETLQGLRLPFNMHFPEKR